MEPETFGNKRQRSPSEERLEEEGHVKRAFNGQQFDDEKEIIVILDAGAQYGKIIDRRIRELHVETVMLPLSSQLQDVMEYNPLGIVITGSGGSVTASDSIQYDHRIFTSEVPILGICYGLQLIVDHFGGRVGKEKVREDGQFEITLDTTSPLFRTMSSREMLLMTHGDSVQTLPDCLRDTGWSGDIVAAVEHNDKKIYGVQFHPEVDLSENGTKVFKSFLFEICGCHGVFKLESREEQCLEYIRKMVGGAEILSLVSGGVDSAVCTALLCKALGPEKVTSVHIDNGFMRKGERQQVVESLRELGIDLQVKEASLTFMNAHTMMNYKGTDGEVTRQATPLLHMVTNAEEKRHIIGDTFMNLATETMQTLQKKSDRKVFLAQGTLRPDLIESASSLASSDAHMIKTHHNDTFLVRELRSKGLVVEPLKDFHKDEVRKLGEALGLHPSIVNRHPFPGPGLAVRVICQEERYTDEDFKSTTATLKAIVQYAERCKEGDSCVKLVQECSTENEREFILSFTNSIKLSTTLLPIHTVGVQGDSRTYSYAVALSSDNPPEWTKLMKLAKIIPRICHSVNRVVWAFGKAITHPVNDITPTHLSQGVLATVREADNVAHQILKYNEAEAKISQMPVVLIPIHFDRNPDDRPLVPSCQRSVVIRTFITSDFMTGIPATPDQHIPFSILKDMVTAVEQIPGISRVLYDLTPKPPGTTEWE